MPTPSIFPLYGTLDLSLSPRSTGSSSAGARQAARPGSRTWSFDDTVEAAFLIPNSAIAEMWPSPAEIARAILTDAGPKRAGVEVSLPKGVYAVVVKVGTSLVVLPSKLQVLAPGAYRLSHQGPEYRWTLDGRAMDRQPPMAGHAPTSVWPDANLPSRFGVERKRPIEGENDHMRGPGRLRAQDPGPRTWSFDPWSVEDAFLIPNRVLAGLWPTASELAAAQLAHDSRRDPYGAGKEVPIGVYAVVVIEGGVPRVLPYKLQILRPGDYQLWRDTDRINQDHVAEIQPPDGYRWRIWQYHMDPKALEPWGPAGYVPAYMYPDERFRPVLDDRPASYVR